MLAEPNLTAMSGETASFLAGGEFPIPVAPHDNGSHRRVQAVRRQPGLRADGDVATGGINLQVRPEVSELTEQGAVRCRSATASIQIPALTVRRAETTVELGSGQSFAIAGLLQDNARTLGQRACRASATCRCSARCSAPTASSATRPSW